MNAPVVLNNIPELPKKYCCRFIRGYVEITCDGITEKTHFSSQTMRWSSLLAVRTDKGDVRSIDLIGTTCSISLDGWLLKNAQDIFKLLSRCLDGMGVIEALDRNRCNRELVYVGGPLFGLEDSVEKIRADIPNATAKQIYSRLRKIAPQVRCKDVEKWLYKDTSAEEAASARLLLEEAFKAARSPQLLEIWQCPPEIRRKLFRDLLKIVRMGQLHIVVITAAIMEIILWLLNAMLPAAVPMVSSITGRMPVFIVLMAIMVLLLGWYDTIAWIGITENGIRRLSADRTKDYTWLWTTLKGFRVSEDPDCPSVPKMTLYFENGRKQNLYLPADKASHIIAETSLRIPLMEKEPAATQTSPVLDSGLNYALLLLTVVISVGMAALMAEFLPKNVAMIILCGLIVAGPGTFSCIALNPVSIWAFRTARTKDLYRLSIVYNMLGQMLTMLFYAIIVTGRGA